MRTTQGLFGDRVVSIQLRHGKNFKLANVDQSYLALQLFWHGGNYYEPITRALLEHLIKPGTTFLDLGAHVGFYSITCALLGNDVRVIAFEPNPNNFRLLQANLAANNLTKPICEPTAISDQTGTAVLYLTESDMSASLMKDFQAEDTRQIDQIKVRTISIDKYVEQHAIRGPLVIKVDIEGHEPAFFRGAYNTIAALKPDIILEVLYDQDPAIMAQLRSLGYHFYPVTDEGLTELETPKLIKRYPFLFLNHLLSARPRRELQETFQKVQAATRDIDLHQTSKHFPKEQWPLLWKTEN